jgi:hypothetical protein
MTIAQQLKIKEVPFIIKDADGKVIYREWSDGYWEKREYADGQLIRYEDCIGRIVDYRPKTDVQKAIDLLTKEGLIVDGQILK